MHLTFEMLSRASRFKQHHQVVCTKIDGEVALFQSSTCDYLVLNETGSAIWNLLRSHPTLPELCKHLQLEYHVSLDECKSSVEAWLEAALEMKVIALV